MIQKKTRAVSWLARLLRYIKKVNLIMTQVLTYNITIATYVAIINFVRRSSVPGAWVWATRNKAGVFCVERFFPFYRSTKLIQLVIIVFFCKNSSFLSQNKTTKCQGYQKKISLHFSSLYVVVFSSTTSWVMNYIFFIFHLFYRLINEGYFPLNI